MLTARCRKNLASTISSKTILSTNLSKVDLFLNLKMTLTIQCLRLLMHSKSEIFYIIKLELNNVVLNCGQPNQTIR